MSGNGSRRDGGLAEVEADTEDIIQEEEDPFPAPGLRDQEAAGTGDTGRRAKRKRKSRRACRGPPVEGRGKAAEKSALP